MDGTPENWGTTFVRLQQAAMDGTPEHMAAFRRFQEESRRRGRMTRKAARAAALAAADAPVGPRPRLEIEIIPSSLHHKSPRETLGRAWWNRTRKQAYAAAGNRCELCGWTGDRHPVEAHEVYFYDELASPPVQHVIRLIALCPACHAVKHLYRTHAVSRERGDPSIYEDALAHLARVNSWDEAQVRAHLEETRVTYERREALGPWRQDFSALGVPSPVSPPSAAEIREWARRNGYSVPDRGPAGAEVQAAYFDSRPEP